jgi:hypothetical protein
MNIQEKRTSKALQRVVQELEFARFGMVILNHKSFGRQCTLVDRTPASLARITRAMENGYAFLAIFPFCFDDLENQLIEALLELDETPSDDTKAQTVQDIMSGMHGKYPDNERSMRHLFQQFCAYGFSRSGMK